MKPLEKRVKHEIRRAKRIDFPVVYRAAQSEQQRRKLRGAMRAMKHDHPDNWGDMAMCGSYLKRLRSHC